MQSKTPRKMAVCPKHGETEFKLITGKPRKDGSCLQQWKCCRCVNERTLKKRTEFKRWAVDYLGGSCSVCGEDRLILLDFHHVEPHDKKFNISKCGAFKPIDEVTAELDKCVLLCCMHHRLLHASLGYDYEQTTWAIKDDDEYNEYDFDE